MRSIPPSNESLHLLLKSSTNFFSREFITKRAGFNRTNRSSNKNVINRYFSSQPNSSSINLTNLLSKSMQLQLLSIGSKGIRLDDVNTGNFVFSMNILDNIKTIRIKVPNAPSHTRIRSSNSVKNDTLLIAMHLPKTIFDQYPNGHQSISPKAKFFTLVLLPWEIVD